MSTSHTTPGRSSAGPGSAAPVPAPPADRPGSADPRPPAGGPPAGPASPRGEDHPSRPDGTGAPSTLARRVGPVVAGVGLLVAIAVLVWIGIAPDNVVGTVAEAGLDVPAVAAADIDADGCIRLVEGDGTSSEVCVDAGSVRLFDDAPPWWDTDGRLVVETERGMAVVDRTTGALTPVGDGPDEFPDSIWPDDRARGIWIDRQVVRLGDWGDDEGDVVLDLGGPVRSLRDASLSPDGTWVVASDDEGRILVAMTDRPAEVHEWFTVDADRWFEAWRQVRWDD